MLKNRRAFDFCSVAYLKLVNKCDFVFGKDRAARPEKAGIRPARVPKLHQPARWARLNAWTASTMAVTDSGGVN